MYVFLIIIRIRISSLFLILRWLIIYISQMFPMPGVAPQARWPENYNCTVYPPPEGIECYEEASIF